MGEFGRTPRINARAVATTGVTPTRSPWPAGASAAGRSTGRPTVLAVSRRTARSSPGTSPPRSTTASASARRPRSPTRLATPSPISRGRVIREILGLIGGQPPRAASCPGSAATLGTSRGAGPRRRAGYGQASVERGQGRTEQGQDTTQETKIQNMAQPARGPTSSGEASTISLVSKPMP